MLCYMDSKVFQNEYLEIEDDKDILRTQYILVTTKIRKRNEKNIIVGYRFFYPRNSVFEYTDEGDMKEEYFNQLDDQIPLLSTLILGSIEEKYTIVFLCTKKESKLNYLSWLAEYVETVFRYPMIDYHHYINWGDVMTYDEKQVAKTCKTVLKKSSKINLEKNKRSERGRKTLERQVDSYDKKRLKKELKKRGLYSDKLTKSEMKELLLINL